MENKLEESFWLLLGSIMGFLFAFGDYGKSPQTSISFLEQPRVKNLILMLTGVIAPIGTAYIKNFNSAESFHIVVEYGVSAIFSIFFWFSLVCVAISLNVWRRNATHPPSDHLGTIPLLLEFLARGYVAYTTLRSTALEAIEKRKELEVGVIPTIMQKLNALLMAVYAHRSTTGPIYKRSFMLDLILRAIEQVTKELIQVGSANISANFMLSTPFSQVTPSQLNNVHFSLPPHHSVTDILILEHYNGIVVPNFSLPVHDNIAECLPGAPLSFKKNDHQAVICKEALRKCPKIDSKIKKSMIAYFESANFKSFLSIPIINGSKVVGVVNIESDTNIFDPKDVGVAHLANSLHPFCTILGSVATED